MSISDEKLAANRANAEHSTGPTSDDGKAKSSRNATMHGLTGKVVVLPHEDKNEFQRFSLEVLACLAPEGVIECEFAQIVANAQWRLRRIKSIEDGMLANGRFGPSDPYAEPESFDDAQVLAQSFMDHTRSFSNLSHYEHRLYRNMTHALQKIETLQAAREKTEKEIKREAQYLFNMWQYTSPLFGRPGTPPEPTPVGFVFPTDQIPNENAVITEPREDEKEAA